MGQQFIEFPKEMKKEGNKVAIWELNYIMRTKKMHQSRVMHLERLNWPSRTKVQYQQQQ